MCAQLMNLMLILAFGLFGFSLAPWRLGGSIIVLDLLGVPSALAVNLQ
jgi:hypothetical protein